MELIIAFIIIVVAAIVLIPIMGSRWKGYVTVTVVSALAVISSIFAIDALNGINTEYIFPGSSVCGEVPLRIDALSGWFILVINFTFLTGAIYGIHYMKPYRDQKSNLSIHYIAYVLVHASLLSICSLQNSIAFLVAWEIMALSSFLLIIFEHYKQETLKAGINFLVQSHVGITLLTIGFVWVALKMNSYDFTSISDFSKSNPTIIGVALFLCFFIGFAIKAGFVPFHTWLPHAHPAAPSHVSGVMSGVIIKIGIYGILRMLLLIKSDYTTIGYIILIISVISGVYGVMLAIIQHNLKKLLAYHSIENIGIIGIGIGLGSIGIGNGNTLLAALGFAGALLHTLNHSLFKSLLFYGAGNVYQSTHTMDIEQLGGLGKRMPQTSLLFLIAAVAICGLPPFNGFVSEFIIYNGMFSGFHNATLFFLSTLAFSLFGFVLIGGLAILCFTKAFGIIFLGSPRHHFEHIQEESSAGKLVPMYAVMVLMIAIGVFPKIFIQMISVPIKELTGNYELTGNPYSMLSGITWCAIAFVGIVSLVYFIRKRITASRPVIINPTWGCGYVAPNVQMQYSASSFIRTYRKLAEPVLQIYKRKQEIKDVFPKSGQQETHPYDKSELWLIDYPIRQLKHFFGRFSFLQNGNPQFYILYGVSFILLVLGVPMIYRAVTSIIQFFNLL